MTTFQKIAFWVCIAVGVAMLVTVSWLIAKNRGYHKGYEDAINSVKVDTITVVDTHFVDKPTEIVKYRDKLVYVPVTDTVVKNDTTYIALQFEKKLYSDSTYKAQVSGFQPSLDWIEVYQKTQTVVKTITETKLPEFILSPSVTVMTGFRDATAGAGVSFDVWRGKWQFSGTVGYGITVGNQEFQHGWFAVATGKYNLIIK